MIFYYSFSLVNELEKKKLILFLKIRWKNIDNKIKWTFLLKPTPKTLCKINKSILLGEEK